MKDLPDFAFFLAWQNKNIMTVGSSNGGIVLCSNRQFSRIFLGSRSPPSPLAKRLGSDYIPTRRTLLVPPTPGPAISHFNDDALLPRASCLGLFFEPLRWCCLGRNCGFFDLSYLPA